METVFNDCQKADVEVSGEKTKIVYSHGSPQRTIQNHNITKGNETFGNIL
jgi:hypothetical protein